MKEIWKPIKGFESYYEVSNTGKVYSIRSERTLSLKPKYTGYIDIELNVNGTTYYKRVHRLVAEAFIPNPQSKPEVNHIDGNKQNNNVNNLEWCTSSENNIHAIKIGLAKTNNMRMYHILYNGDEFIRVEDLKTLSNMIGYCPNSIIKFKKNGIAIPDKKYKGYKIKSFRE